MNSAPISPADLARLLSYDKDSGELKWKPRPNARPEWNTKYANKPAFTAKHKTGYRWGSIGNRQYLAHRVAFALVTGEWPDVIDHINGDRQDNRWPNLRNVSQVENCRNAKMSRNNKSGYNGVYWDNRWQRWKARITVDRKNRSLGTFNCATAAAVARIKANAEYGFSDRHGKGSLN